MLSKNQITNSVLEVSVALLKGGGKIMIEEVQGSVLKSLYVNGHKVGAYSQFCTTFGDYLYKILKIDLKVIEQYGTCRGTGLIVKIDKKGKHRNDKATK